jgi:hypothetical protein
MNYTLSLLSGLCWLLSSLAFGQETTSFTVLPRVVSLSGQHASAEILVQRTVSDRTGDTAIVGTAIGSQITEGVTLEVADPHVATIIDGRVVAQQDGATELLVRISDSQRIARIPVIVQNSQGPMAWEFEAHVQAILAKQGCNSGACHGALAGKGGFRLSLRGYDSVADHYTITRQDRGRRIEPADPGRSLLLAKPTTLLPHKGGLRLLENSQDYQILANWIASGSPGPLATDAKLEGIEVLPRDQVLRPGDQQQLVVLAHYNDGRTEDVTHWAKFNSTSEVVAQVDEQGRLKVMGAGKGAVVAWFASRVAIASLIVPTDTTVPAKAYANFEPSNLIDEILLEEWQALGLAPSATCSDATFLRRASLAATGTLPSIERVRQFLNDPTPDRRERVVDELLSSATFIDYWSYQWSDLLLVNGNLLRPDAVAAFYKWIRSQVENNTPWDEFARQIVLARGDSFEQGATNFYAIHQDPESLTENTCQAFMGLSIGCAKCHNHPLEKWTNDQYYAMANLYSRVRAKGWGGDSRSGDGRRSLVVLERGDLIQPSTGVPQPPAPLDAPPLDLDATGDRREFLAQWLTSHDNRYFSRAIVNRVWANYMGVGLVESVDDLRASNPASSERLMNALADYLVEHNFDLKALMRLIMNSQTFQLSAQATNNNEMDGRFYSRYYPQRLMAEVMHDAIVSVTGVPTKFTEIEFAGADKVATSFYPEGTRSLELYDSAVANYFLKTFGRHQRRITCDCERSDQPTVVQVLHLSNGDTLNQKLSDPNSRIAQWEAAGIPLAQVVENAYLAALSRFPTADESTRLLQLISEADADGVPRRESYEDLLWSLMTSSEFLFTF